ncbi:hypothetical protein EATG_00610 [Escherichia coli H605]|uniref:Uncharacterized protein n=1 Tax=Escherichia coli H605 TaxID=656410 RepID=A0AAJ3U0L8_ECOLX|nr:hypothetical protein EATG_00610 [Escherichia coli H605]
MLKRGFTYKICFLVCRAFIKLCAIIIGEEIACKID